MEEIPSSPILQQHESSPTSPLKIPQWSTPIPLAEAFTGNGSLPTKKERNDSHLSLNSHLYSKMPKTPIKRDKSKFVMPEMLSACAISPINLSKYPGMDQQYYHSSPGIPQHSPTSNSVPIPHPNTSRLNRQTTMLSRSFSVEDDEVSVLFSDTDNDSPFVINNSSPIPFQNGSDNINLFSIMDDDDDNNIDDNNGDYDNGDYDLFDSPHTKTFFYEKDFFANPDWSKEEDDICNITTIPYEDHLNSDILLSEDTSNHLLPTCSIFSSPPMGAHSSLLPVEKESINIDFLKSHFDIIECIGSGSFSIVYKVLRKSDNVLMALKKTKEPIYGSKTRIKRLKEVEAMWKCSTNPNTIEIISSWEQDHHLFILMEYCENGTLEDVINHITNTNELLSTIQILQIIESITKALVFLHTVLNIVHLDLKPANIFITERGQIKLGDFGMAFNPLQQHTQNDGNDEIGEGDKIYLAPECLDGSQGFPSDVFSFGLIILELLTNISLPAMGDSWLKLRRGVFDEVPFDGVDPIFIDLILWMTQPIPSNRGDILEINQFVTNQINFLLNKS